MNIIMSNDEIIRKVFYDPEKGFSGIEKTYKNLKKMGYHGSINLEYEIHSDDPLPGMLESMAYLRGVAAGLA